MSKKVTVNNYWFILNKSDYSIKFVVKKWGRGYIYLYLREMKVCYMQMTYQMQSKYKRAVHHSSKIDLVRPYLETESSFLRRVRFATNENGICINMQPFALQNTGHLLGGDAVSAADDGEDDVARFDSLENGDGFGVRETDEGLVVDG